MKTFDIPIYYKSNSIQRIKKMRDATDPKRKDYSPTELNFGPVIFYLGRHFGFCYGVENAIEISYEAIEVNPNKKIFLLSEMIHNPGVNADLISRGVKFIMDTSGKQIIDWNDLSEEDVVIVPAFGTTIEIQDKINEIGINTLEYDTTCPFVEKVWNKATVLGKAGYTIIVHGKHDHEETRATFSHSKEHAPTLIVRNIEETSYLCDIIMEEKPYSDFYKYFEGKYSEGFDPEKHLNKIGVVNQTTMLATETQEIADWLKCALMSRYGENKIREHFAETRDTLCYATHDNQKSTYALLEEDADLALVVGGYNSSNTSHIVELCEKKLNTYFISNEEKIISKDLISHFDIKTQKEIQTGNYLPDKKPLKIILTSGASCPDVIVESVMQKILSFYENVKTIEEII